MIYGGMNLFNFLKSFFLQSRVENDFEINLEFLVYFWVSFWGSLPFLMKFLRINFLSRVFKRSFLRQTSSINYVFWILNRPYLETLFPVFPTQNYELNSFKSCVKCGHTPQIFSWKCLMEFRYLNKKSKCTHGNS